MSPDQPIALTEFDIGYVMGLVVGEGSFTGDGCDCWLAVKLHESDPTPILELKRLLGGHIYGPYEHDSRRYWFYRLNGFELRANIALFYERLPKSRKREQFLEWAVVNGLDFGEWANTQAEFENALTPNVECSKQT